ncbi:MAG TPA: hypothetical protein VIJ78_06880 [Pseudolabrys sp.]
MVKRSLEAAKAIRAGNIKSLIVSVSMMLFSGAVTNDLKSAADKLDQAQQDLAHSVFTFGKALA